MNAPLRRFCALACFCLTILSFLVAGCGQPVREDRSINWSGEGQSVGFQHGEDGVFLADKDSGKLTKIFQPGGDVVATSSPLWSPKGMRVIFTTARTLAGQPNVSLLTRFNQTPDPAGNVYTQQEVIYTCWLYEDTGRDPPSKPEKLFEAPCDHVGYVAANLAVRWHPSGERVLYVKQVGTGQTCLFEFDLATKKSHGVLSYTAEELIFDWTPDGSKLVCVLGSKSPQPNDGIWIGQPDSNSWLHVPQSDQLAPADLPSVLERLRATRPAWTPDGTRFAFPTFVAGHTNDDPGHSFLRLGTLTPPMVQTLAEGREPFRDLRWTPDGERLGVVRGNDNASLHVIKEGSDLSTPINRRPVRQFVGWNGTGKRLAYIVPGGKPIVESEEWALLLLPDDRARDAVYVADGAGNDPGGEVFSGMRVTFPQWSPTEDKLSLWVTFTPTHQSWASQFLGGGLRPGDPAAIFDATTGHLTWMAVNPFEQMQVGHYYLSKREYLLAWRWYERAEAQWPAPAPISSSPWQIMNSMRAFTEPQDYHFFQYYCLSKLGRTEEAQAKLVEFQKAFPPRIEPRKASSEPQWDDSLRELLGKVLEPDGFFAPLLRDLYCAQVFLSLDAAEDSETFFRDSLKTAPNDAARLSHSIVLGQILLLEHKNQEYATLATETVAPLLLKAMKTPPGDANDATKYLQLSDGIVGGACLLPMCAPEFLAGLPKEQVAALLPRWEALRTEAPAKVGPNQIDVVQGIEFVLYAVHKRLGKEQECKELAKRLWDNEAGPPKDVENLSKWFAETRRNLKAMSQRWRGSVS